MFRNHPSVVKLVVFNPLPCSISVTEEGLGRGVLLDLGSL